MESGKNIFRSHTMKTVVLLCALVGLIVGQDHGLLSTHPFETLLDHFRPQDGRVVTFTYTLNREFYTPNGPIYVFVNDGGRIKNEFLLSGLIYDVARESGGALVTADHRYSGVNLPTEGSTFEELQFLTVEQALNDIAILIATVQRDLGSSGRVILWGTGYGATLATFARKKFPHLVHAAFASSPYFRAESIDNTYYDNLSMIIRLRGSYECGDRVNAAFYVLEYLIANSEADYLQERLGLCQAPNVQNPQEVAMIVYRFIDIIANYVKANQLYGIQNFCYAMDAIYLDPFNSLLRWIEYAYGTGTAGCINANYEVVIEALRNTVWNEQPHGVELDRANIYLMCTQVGGLKVTSDFALDIFPADLITDEYQYQFCEDVLGAAYNRSSLAGAVDALNLSHGGQDQFATRVAFSNAGLDPFIHHGIADHDPWESVVVYLQHNAAGSDLYSLTPEDNENLATAKRTITSYVHRWATGIN